MKLKQYQEEGVIKCLDILKKFRGVLLADEMGLGKTAQAIALIKELNARKVLIVSPASLTENWKNELALWGADCDSQIWSFDKFARELSHPLFHLIIIDEAHNIKSVKAKRTKAVLKQWSKNKDQGYLVLLTGTPILSYTQDLFMYCNLIASHKFPIFKNFWDFAKRYCDARKGFFGWDTTGTSKAEELQGLLNQFTVRRFKKDVLKELLPKTRSTVVLPFDSERAKKLLEKLEKPLPTELTFEILKKISLSDEVARARKEIGALKIKGAIQWIKDFQGYEDKQPPLVVFAYHQEVLQALKAEFPDASYIDGTTIRRIDEVNKFQVGGSNLFIGQIIAAGTGITLTRASACVFIELDWNPGIVLQAEDRIHRIGQTDPVNIYYLSLPHSMDYSVANLMKSKLDNILDLLDGSDSFRGVE